MFETTIQFKPREQWRPGMTPERWSTSSTGRAGSGLTNVWVAADPQPHRHARDRHQEPCGRQGRRRRPRHHRSADDADRSGGTHVPGVSSALAERLTGGRYIDVEVDRLAAARHGLSVADVQAVVATAIGGDNVGEVIQGRERYPINVRYPREVRDSLERLRQLPFVTARGCAGAAPGRRQDRRRGRAADAEERERPPLGLGLCRRSRPRPALGGERHAGRGDARRPGARRATPSPGRASSSTSSAPRPG
jgi:hypothetical protein